MKVKMTDYFQGRETKEEQLVPGKVYDLGDELAQWLIDNRKAKRVLVGKAETVPAVEEAEEKESVPLQPKQRGKAKRR